MSLHELRRRLELAELKPHTLSLQGDVQGLLNVASWGASGFLAELWGERVQGSDLLGSERWPEWAIESYEELDGDERLEVLGIVGFLAHEVTHRVDLLCTPFGVGFQGRACMEFIGLQNDFGEILGELKSSAENRPLRDVERTSDAMSVNVGPAALKARVRYFDALRGAPPRYVGAGWFDDTEPLRLLGQSLEKVLVHEAVASVALPGSQGLYLRPLTILEGRAVAVAALNLFNRLGRGELAASEVAAYMRGFYGSREAFPDYVFLLDLYAGLWGSTSFPQAIEHRGPQWLGQALMITIVIGWYALHAPPYRKSLGEDAAFADSSPVIRLIVALREFEDAVTSGAGFGTGAEFLDAIDTGDRAAGAGLQPVGDAVRFSAEYAQGIRHNNSKLNAHQPLREHFDLVLAAQERQLRARFANGYASQLGLPEWGDLRWGLNSASVDDVLFGPNPDRPPEVDAWFGLREMLLFRYARPPGFWDDLDDYLRVTTIFGRCPQCEEPSVAHEVIPTGTRAVSVECPEGHSFEVELDSAQWLATEHQ